MECWHCNTPMNFTHNSAQYDDDNNNIMCTLPGRRVYAAAAPVSNGRRMAANRRMHLHASSLRKKTRVAKLNEIEYNNM